MGTQAFNPSLRAAQMQEARALNAPVYAGRGAAINSVKDLMSANAANMKGPKGHFQRSAAYPNTGPRPNTFPKASVLGS